MAGQDDPLFSVRARRKVLMALGYGAANAALVGLVGWGGRTDRSGGAGGPLSSSTIAPGTGDATTIELVDLTANVRQGIPPAMAGADPQPPQGHRYQVVITNGRVIDPDSGFDGPATVGIDGARITALTFDGDLTGDVTIDAAGRVVAPGFIDLLSYEPNPMGVWYKLADGVTTNLAMHGVSNYAEPFFDRYTGTTPIHFGGAFHQHFLRGADLKVGVEDVLTPPQIRRFQRLLEENLAGGLAGVSFSPEYAPGTTLGELIALTETAAGVGHMAFFHARYSDPDPPGTGAEAVAEVLEVARRTGAPVHIEHLTSTGGTFEMADTLATLERARSDGIDVTACLYPYDYWGTYLASPRFALGWQQRFRLDYGDLQVAGTERRLSAATFPAAVEDNLLVAALGSIPEEEVQLALARDWTMVASDAILEPALNNHPRAAGTFSRTLGRYVRDLGLLDLRTALAKMTILPARRVETMLPDMARKGRLQRGADADIVVFDPDVVADRATVATPDRTSIGIDWVLVDGNVALADGQARRDVRAGRALRSRV